jgi:hypothetical protein
MQEEVFIIIVVGVGAVVLISVVSIIAGMIQSTMKTREKERSRREIAAYVAEGSISADEGERLIDAGRPAWEREWLGRRRT